MKVKTIQVKIANRKKAILIIALILAGLLAIRIVTFRTNRFEQKTNKSIEEARLFLSQLSNLLNTSEELVITARGFHTIKEDAFLNAYNNTRGATLQSLLQLPTYLSAEETLLKQRVDSLNVLVRNEIRLSDNIIELSKTNVDAKDLLERYIKEAANLSSLIKSVSSSISSYKENQLQQMELTASKTARLFNWLFVINLVALFFVLVVGFLLVYRSLKARSKAEKVLHSYKQSNQFINSLAEGIIVQNEKGYIIECNLAAQKILGLRGKQIQGTTWVDSGLEMVHADGSAFPDKMNPAMLVLKTGTAQRNIIMGIQKANGELTWIQVNSHPIHSDEGKLEGVVTTFIDNTEQKHATDQLKQSEQYRKSFMNAAKEGFLMVDQNYRVIIANNASKEIIRENLGIIVKEEMNLFNRLPEERKIVVLNHLGKVFKGERVEYEVYYDFIPGRKDSWMFYSISPVMNENKIIIAACITLRDITERKRIEQELQKNEERLRQALDKTGDNAWEHNFKTGITWFSSAHNRFLGFNKNEIMQNENKSHWWQSTHPEDKGLLQKNDEEYRAGLRESHSLEYRIYHEDGSMKWVLDRGVVIEKNEDGTPLRIVGTHTDITNEKELRNKMVEQEQQKKQAIVEAVIQAQEKEREEISYELHEEVSQVLSTVKIFLGIAAQNPPDSQNYLQMATERTTEAIEELRKISQNINSSTLKIIGLTHALKDLVGQAKQNSTVQFKIDYTNYDAAIDIDFPVQLTIFRIVQAQIKNIIRHSEAETASVTLSNSEQIVKLSIVDNGKGFNKKNAHYGLGFQNIIHRAEQYHGSVEIITEPGKGCRLHVTLPLSVI